ncbi:MFS transporter [Streptomyces sp. RGM 3693]|uniref:MFS transporter n=1 Tax=Streptomyces sp. RGM 3693 TaxID=3413284 RepID=UPI003D2A7380
MALAVVLSGTFLANLDSFIVVVALPALKLGLGASEGEQELVLVGYQLAFGMGLITGGRLGDHFGFVRVFAFGMGVFTVASVGCGLAPFAGFLVAARLAQGAGTSLMVPQAFRAAQSLFSGGARRRAFAVTGTVMGVGAVSGQLLGGWLLAADVYGLGWRAVFLVNVPMGAAAFAALPWAAAAERERARRNERGSVPRNLDERVAAWPPARLQLDLPGTCLAALALGLFMTPMVIGGTAGVSWWSLALLVAPAAAGFLRYERAVERRGGRPLLPSELLRCPGFGRGLALVALANCGLSSFILTLGLLLQEGLGWRPLATGAGMLPAAVAFALTSLLTPAWKVSQRRLLGWAAAVSASGYLGCAAAVVFGEVRWLLVAVGVAGAGLGLLVAPALAFTLKGVPEHVAGAGAGVVATAQQCAAALGVCAFGALFFALVDTGTDIPTAFAAVTVAIAATAVLAGWLTAGIRSAPDSARGRRVPAARGGPGDADDLL